MRGFTLSSPYIEGYQAFSYLLVDDHCINASFGSPYQHSRLDLLQSSICLFSLEPQSAMAVGNQAKRMGVNEVIIPPVLDLTFRQNQNPLYLICPRVDLSTCIVVQLSIDLRVCMH
jgi:hypothetical protein